MAKLQVYSVFDAKVEAFAQPFFMRTNGEALRGWIDVCNDKSTNFNKYPSDFTLFHLGEFDEDTGFITCFKTPISLGLAISFIKPSDGVNPVSLVSDPEGAALKSV